MTKPISMFTAATRSRVIAAALALGRHIDLWSLLFLILALCSLWGTPLSQASTLCLLLSLPAAGIQKIWALRVAFDETLFRHWANNWSLSTDPTLLVRDLAELDHALFTCGLRSVQSETFRHLDSRVRGALGLLKKQMLAAIIQFLAVISAVLLDV